MARIINSEKCQACGSCVDACPVGAITMEDDCAVIDAGSCIDCGVCEGTCPCEAITGE